METRMKKHRQQQQQQASPERTKVWTEKSPKYHQRNRKVAVVYYLSRNCQLEHPHFIKVPLSSPDGLYLRDVIEMLNNFRGRGMASLYSWSCKRSYRNGFVWHDLCEDDLILPAHGNEYVLKGSELFHESNSDQFSPVVNSSRLQNPKQLPEPPSCSRSQDDSSSSRTKDSHDDELSSPINRPTPGSSGASPESRYGCSLGLTEYKVSKSDGLADASTQTEENSERTKTRETCTRGVSTDDGTLEPECNADFKNQAPNPCVKDSSELCMNPVSPSTGGKIETLVSLIRADASRINSFRFLEEEGIRMPTTARLKATSMLIQLISCGSISMKDHRFGLVPTYRRRFSHSKYSSPLFSTSIMSGELDRLSENPRSVSNGTPTGGSSRRITEHFVSKTQSKRLDSFREEEQVIEIEES